MVQASATARYVRTSAQKAGLVLDLIRGKSFPEAQATLKFARKGVARDILKVLESAVANAKNKDKNMGSFFVFLSDADELQSKLDSVAKKHDLKHTVLSIDNPAGPRAT